MSLSLSLNKSKLQHLRYTLNTKLIYYTNNWFHLIKWPKILYRFNYISIDLWYNWHVNDKDDSNKT